MAKQNFIRQAITTKYIGPTNSRGSRVKAKAAAGSISVSWDAAKNPEDNHFAAATALANKMEWLDNGWYLVGGGLPDETGNCYVLVKDEDKSTATNDWRDAVVDMLLTGDERSLKRAITTITGEIGEKAVAVSDWQAMGEWKLEPGRSFTLNDVEAFSIHSYNSSRRPPISAATGRGIHHADIDDIAKDVLKMLKGGEE